jgi:hypothetical protein
MVLPPHNTRYCDFSAILRLFIGRVFQNLRGSRHFIHSSVSAHDKAIGSCHRIRYELVVIRVTLLPNKRILPLTRCLLMGDPNIVSYIDGKYYDYRCLMIFLKRFFSRKDFYYMVISGTASYSCTGKYAYTIKETMDFSLADADAVRGVDTQSFS